MKRPCFVTVCGGGVDYEFLLGSIEHHALMGDHFVLDTTPKESSRIFRQLPSSVVWMHDPGFGSGWDTFEFGSALFRASLMAISVFNPDVLIQLDSDDWFSDDSGDIFELAKTRIVELQYVHWMSDGKPYLFGESEWHRRVWPRLGGKVDSSNRVHPRVVPVGDTKVVRVDGLYRHHAHFAILPKASDTRIAESSISGWPHAKTEVELRPWPEKLSLWKDLGILPSRSFL